MPNYAQQTTETELSVIPSNQQDEDEKITILNPMDETVIDFAPVVAFGASATWILHLNKTFEKILDRNDGFVDPVSTNLLWQAVDLEYPSLRLALGLHVRNGQIQHIFPALDLFFGDGEHRNRGLNTVPRAHTWISMVVSKGNSLLDPISLLSNFQIMMATRDVKKGENEWSIHANLVSIKEALELAIFAIVEDPPSDLGEGSNFVHVPVHEILECPKVGQEVRVELHGPQKMEHGTGILQVRVHAAQAGSKSEHLPEAYEALFNNTKYQNAKYFAFQKKKEHRRQTEKESAAAARRLQERKAEEL